MKQGYKHIERLISKEELADMVKGISYEKRKGKKIIVAYFNHMGTKYRLMGNLEVDE